VDEFPLNTDGRWHWLLSSLSVDVGVLVANRSPRLTRLYFRLHPFLQTLDMDVSHGPCTLSGSHKRVFIGVRFGVSDSAWELGVRRLLTNIV
jgi:hypothetical protein